MVLGDRDTDADWVLLGERQPHWAVLTDPRFRSDVLSEEARAIFYQSGRDYVDGLMEAFTALCGGVAPRPRRALDFGCGVGRLSEAMALHADAVTGLDISQGMLAVARTCPSGRVRYVDHLEDEQFDWINSIIVFQHIPPRRGLPLMETLLTRLAPGGLLSLQITTRGAGERSVIGRLRREVQALKHRLLAPKGSITMYEYDLDEVVKRLNDAGLERIEMRPADCGGHTGVLMLASRGPV